MKHEFPAIVDLTGYTEKMRKGFLEKTFFLEKISATVYLDYGCADGSMIEFMHKMFPEYHYFGYDIDPKMIELAKKRNIPNAVFSDDYWELSKQIDMMEDSKKAVICSSIIHEIYAYDEPIYEFWGQVESFDYICIRDMMTIDETLTKPVSLDDAWKIANYYLNDKDDAYILKTYQDKWGQITTTQNMIHFLLKYRYKNNWERELNENYFWLSLEEFTKQFTDSSFEISYMNHYTLPFLKSKVKEDFGIELIEKTHIQVILERK